MIKLTRPLLILFSISISHLPLIASQREEAPSVFNNVFPTSRAGEMKEIDIEALYTILDTYPEVEFTIEPTNCEKNTFVIVIKFSKSPYLASFRKTYVTQKQLEQLFGQEALDQIVLAKK